MLCERTFRRVVLHFLFATCTFRLNGVYLQAVSRQELTSLGELTYILQILSRPVSSCFLVTFHGG